MTQAHPYDWTIENPPLGVWTTAEASFSAIMGAVMTIRPDGTGQTDYYEGEAVTRSEVFVWQFKAPGNFRIFIPDEELPEPQSDEDWENIPYRPDWKETEFGRGPVLINNGNQGPWMTEERFWILTGPIHLKARAPDA